MGSRSATTHRFRGRLIVGALCLAASGCGGETTPGPGLPSSVVELQQLRKIEVIHASYPGILYAGDAFQISYETPQGIFVDVYDAGLANKLGTHQLSPDESPDHQMVFDGGFFYMVSSFFLRKYDSELNEIAVVSVIDDLPPEVKEQWSPDGGLDDMLLYAAKGSILVGVPVGSPQKGGPGKGEPGKDEKMDLPDDLLLLQYDEQLNLVATVTLDALGNTPASSMLQKDGVHTVVCADRHWDDSSLIAAHYDSNWSLVDKTTISAVADANEEFPMGFTFANGHYFVSYNHITGDLAMPIMGEPDMRTDIMLKVFDPSWQLVAEALVTDDIPASVKTRGVNSAHLAVAGEKIYVAYEADDGMNHQVFVKEYALISH